MLEQSDFTKLETDVVYLSALRKFDEFVGAKPADPQFERDPKTGIRRKLLTPGRLVSAPVTVNNQTFYWPSIVEFSPEEESDYARTVVDPHGDGNMKIYYVTLITMDWSSWLGSWVAFDTLRPFNILSEPEKSDASHIPHAQEVFGYVKEHLYMSDRDRLLKLSFMYFVAYNNNVRRWEIRG